ncbi:SMI1/KNR4 family protein [Streptomyces sp. ms191]|uniref:SMI1/KNR4 family protein n=1 Tax=Streptomyces sp. ms191 TaxID=1827978 RepID=UPI0011CE5A13|nr:SMI1/KNR4 family protein [Streptomyces sp. ms191]TXS21374.1 SMI1/KNR4 family protein [Streptomyces sp. ms191]
MTTDWAAEYRRMLQGHRHGAGERTTGRHREEPPAPLTTAELREAEEELGITFPEDYRDHLLRRSAGGRINRLRRDAAGWGWDGDSDTNYDLLRTDFPHPDSYRAYEDDLDDREPLEKDFADGAAFQAAWDDWDNEYGVHQERKTAGAVYIQEHGCGFSTLLVVTGPRTSTPPTTRC